MCKINFADDPILKIGPNVQNIERWNSLPPIFKTETFVNPKLNSKSACFIENRECEIQ